MALADFSSRYLCKSCTSSVKGIVDGLLNFDLLEVTSAVCETCPAHSFVQSFVNRSAALIKFSSSSAIALQRIMSPIFFSECPNFRARLGVEYECFSSLYPATALTAPMILKAEYRILIS